jgi:hypothetical protein
MNTLTQYIVPEWISTAFLLSIPLPFILISLFVRKETLNTNYNKAFPFVVGFFILYLAYICLSSHFGFFNHISLPPKVLLFTTFPFAFLLFVLVEKTGAYKAIFASATLERLVSLHIFRVIGVFFILLALHDTLPKPFAYIAGLGDIITAISSIFVAKAIRDKKYYAKKLTYFWNIFGTIDILYTAIAANVLTKISIDTGSMGVDTLAFFPFCIIPAFAPPIILFLHWTIFKKIKEITE